MEKTAASCCTCRSPHGERGLKYLPGDGRGAAGGRSPHGERGLKSCGAVVAGRIQRSLPSRGAWIEIRLTTWLPPCPVSRSPHGERGLKLIPRRPAADQGRCRSPHGERGLKYHIGALDGGQQRSLPSRGAWIEIFLHFFSGTKHEGRSPHGERGLKSKKVKRYHLPLGVAPLTGSVD